MNKNEKTYSAKGVIIHPDYDYDTIQNDIALVLLSKDIEFGDGVRVIKLPESSDEGLLSEGETVTVAGWGNIEGKVNADILQKMEFEFSNRIWCQRYWLFRRMNIHDGMICTERVQLEGGSEISHLWVGDSGSALFVRNDDDTFTQLALVSWSSDQEQIFAPDVHTNVFYYREWIRDQMSMVDSTYVQKIKATYNTYQEVEFTNMRYYLYRSANLHTLDVKHRVQADVFLINFALNHFVMIYDGADVEEDKMMVMLMGSEELTGILSSSMEGLTVVIQTNDQGDLSGSVRIRYRATSSGAATSPRSLRCPTGFWPCVDELHCIR